MATQVLTGQKIWIDQFALAGDTKNIALEYGADLLDVTTFADTTRIRKGGLKTVGLAIDGFANEGATAVSKTLYDRVGASHVLTVSGQAGADGERAHIARLIGGSLQFSGSVGEMLEFTFDGEADAPLSQGVVLKNGTVTATGNGTAYQPGAIDSGKSLYGTLHIISISGASATITVKIQSDDNAGFASPTDRITFTAATAVGAQFATPVAGPITDDYWRAVWTVSGTTPSIALVCAMGEA